MRRKETDVVFLKEAFASNMNILSRNLTENDKKYSWNELLFVQVLFFTLRCQTKQGSTLDGPYLILLVRQYEKHVQLILSTPSTILTISLSLYFPKGFNYHQFTTRKLYLSQNYYYHCHELYVQAVLAPHKFLIWWPRTTT